jgi:phage tail sheath protein FI
LDVWDASITSVTTQANLLDTNYAAGYYPWVRVLDDLTGTFIWAPPSVVLPEVYKYSDNVGAEWFAPAGLNRGGIPGAIGVKTRLTQAQRDTLYESKVNPIAQFPGQGICVWGQKTLQRRASALDRVNVRRLLITVKKYIASSARYLVFEQNTEATRTRFLNIVNPYLAAIQQNSGLTAFRVIMDETNNTPDIIDRNILQGAIYLQPTRTAEFIKLDFNILPTGASFDTF